MKKKFAFILINLTLLSLAFGCLMVPSLFNEATLGTYYASGEPSKISSFKIKIDNKSTVYFNDGDVYAGKWYVKHSQENDIFDLYVKVGQTAILQLRKESDTVFYNVHNNKEFYIKK